MRTLHQKRTPPASLFAPQGFLSRDECQALFAQVVGLTTGGGTTKLRVSSTREGVAEWALNRTRVVSDAQHTDLTITRTIAGAEGWMRTRRLDADGLRHAVRMAEYLRLAHRPWPENLTDPYVDQPISHPTLWSEPTYQLGAEGCTDLAQQLIAPAESAGMISTGALRVVAQSEAVMRSDGMARFYPTTEIQCSMTVRDTGGTASGWAGVNHYDIAKIDPAALAATALDKARRSAHPVAVEPGRWTAILEPQATADLVAMIDAEALDRLKAEMRQGPFKGPTLGTSKISEQVLDRRLILRSDPMDPEGGFVPFEENDGTPYLPVNWIDKGVLKELKYREAYALAKLGYDHALLKPPDFRLTTAPGVPTMSVEEMIATTDRGVLVTRFSGVQLVDFGSLLCTGYTRDGVWLIERGKISKPIQNFRFIESPLFILNNLDAVGTPVRVFAPGSAYVAPPVRVRDFSFVALADAI